MLISRHLVPDLAARAVTSQAAEARRGICYWHFRPIAMTEPEGCFPSHAPTSSIRQQSGDWAAQQGCTPFPKCSPRWRGWTKQHSGVPSGPVACVTHAKKAHRTEKSQNVLLVTWVLSSFSKYTTVRALHAGSCLGRRGGNREKTELLSPSLSGDTEKETSNSKLERAKTEI